jgi:hypothetical protein
MFFAVEIEWFSGRSYVTPASAAMGMAGQELPPIFFFFLKKIKKLIIGHVAQCD